GGETIFATGSGGGGRFAAATGGGEATPVAGKTFLHLRQRIALPGATGPGSLSAVLHAGQVTCVGAMRSSLSVIRCPSFEDKEQRTADNQESRSWIMNRRSHIVKKIPKSSAPRSSRRRCHPPGRARPGRVSGRAAPGRAAASRGLASPRLRWGGPGQSLPR